MSNVVQSLMPPRVKVDDGFYRDAKEKGGSAFSLLPAVDPSPPEHVEAIYGAKLLEWSIDPKAAPYKASRVRAWAEGAACLERQVAVDPKFMDAGGLKYGRVKDFQTSIGSAAIFPAWIDSQIQAGLLQAGVVNELIFGTEAVDSPNVTAVTLSDNAGERGMYKTSMGAELREVSVVLSSGSMVLNKFGKAFKAPYEVVGLRTLDVMGTLLQRAGAQIAIDETDECLDIAIAGDGTTAGAAESNSTDVDATVSGTISYSDMVNALLNAGDPYMPNYVIADASALVQVANLAEFKDPDVVQAVRNVDFPSPLLCRWRRWEAVQTSGVHYLTGMIIFLDTRVALKKLTWGPMLEETDKLIQRQTNVWTFSYYAGFQKWDVKGVTPYDWSSVL